MLLFGISDGLFNQAASTPVRAAQPSNPGHQLLLPPADWRPTSAVWTTQGIQAAVRGGRDAAVIKHVREHGPGVLAGIQETGALGPAAEEELRRLLTDCLAAFE